MYISNLMYCILCNKKYILHIRLNMKNYILYIIVARSWPTLVWLRAETTYRIVSKQIFWTPYAILTGQGTMACSTNSIKIHEPWAKHKHDIPWPISSPYFQYDIIYRHLSKFIIIYHDLSCKIICHHLSSSFKRFDSPGAEHMCKSLTETI